MRGLSGSSLRIVSASSLPTPRPIVALTRMFSSSQTCRVRVEDVLGQPGEFLPPLANWLGVRADQEAIQGMQHPERSPYAAPGPKNARWANDPEFLESPRLRPASIPSCVQFPPEWNLDDRTSDLLRDFASELGYD